MKHETERRNPGSETGDTIVALATPLGTSAVALVRVSGPAVISLSEALWGRQPPARLAQHVDYFDVHGTLVDDVLATFFKGPASYTGEDSLEISCHGNPYIAQRILEDLCDRGCRVAEPGEFTQRAFLGGKMDLSQAEAVMDLIHARSERALAMAQQLLRGALGRSLARVIEDLLAASARVEAYIDFPDEDLPAQDQKTLALLLEGALQELRRLVATGHYGEILRRGLGVVIVGETNAGKSSLLNALLGRERALVSEEPGTTRDFIEEGLLVGPHYLRLTDTAGLNSHPGLLERRGIEKTLEQALQADVLLWVVEAGKELPPLPSSLREGLVPGRALLLINKCDLGQEAVVKTSRISDPLLSALPQVVLSALKGEGLELLRTELVRLADSFQIQEGSERVVINARHAAALTRGIHALEAALEKLKEGGALELLASDLRAALEACGAIAGRIDNERMLDALFRTFCIGK